MIDFIEAIHILYPQVTVTRGDKAYDASGNVVSIDESAVQAYVNANEYKAQRAAEYPSIADQLDKIFHDGIEEWKETIQAVKDKYPKP